MQVSNNGRRNNFGSVIPVNVNLRLIGLKNKTGLLNQINKWAKQKSLPTVSEKIFDSVPISFLCDFLTISGVEEKHKLMRKIFAENVADYLHEFPQKGSVKFLEKDGLYYLLTGKDINLNEKSLNLESKAAEFCKKLILNGTVQQSAKSDAYLGIKFDIKSIDFTA